jgi:hypothetical protein
MKALAAGLLIIICILSWRLSGEVTQNGQMRSEIEQLQGQLADKSKLQDLQLQAKCAEQAKKVFHELGYKDTQQNLNTDIYQSHYNTKLGKCFMAVESTDMTTNPGTQFTYRFLMDAFEQREYAEYTWMSRKDKKYWEVPPTICKLMESSTKVQVCKSEDEYKAFIARYIE